MGSVVKLPRIFGQSVWGLDRNLSAAIHTGTPQSRLWGVRTQHSPSARANMCGENGTMQSKSD